LRFRTDLTNVTSSRATWLLAEFGAVVEGEIKRYRGVALRGLDYDDLRAIARIAVLEASLTHDPALSALRTWVRLRVKQRLVECIRSSQQDVELTDDVESLPNGRNPHELLEAMETTMWVRGAIDVLDPRPRTIVVATLAGETLRQIGPTLGISKSRVGQERRKALEIIRQQALEAGLRDE
jgi:RNA polymerase sigma factor (sigma-70 family)